MTAPNLVFATSVVGKTEPAAVTTNLTALLTNPAASNKMLKVSALTAINKSANNAAISVILTKIASGGGATQATLAHAIVAPVNSNLMLVTRNSPVYLEEGMTLAVSASVNDALEVICSYEEVM